jgi:hypothetical protein
MTKDTGKCAMRMKGKTFFIINGPTGYAKQ